MNRAVLLGIGCTECQEKKCLYNYSIYIKNSRVIVLEEKDIS